MKKLLFLLCLIPLIGQAQIKLQPKVSVSYGHEKVRLMDEQSGRYDYHLPNFCFRTGLDAKYKHFTAYYDTKVWCSNSSWRFTPTQAIYEVGLSYQITDILTISRLMGHTSVENTQRYIAGFRQMDQKVMSFFK